MKKYMPFNGLRWSRDSGSALYDIPQTAVFGRAGGAKFCRFALFPLMLLMLLLLPANMVAQTEASSSKYIATYESSTQTLTFKENVGETLPSNSVVVEDKMKVADIKRNFENGTIVHIVFDKSFSTYAPTSLSSFFGSLTKLETITGLEYLNTANVTDMSYMFSGCSKLTSLDVTHFNTANVTNMCYMFSSCLMLTSLDVTKFNTENVTNMNKMFYGCSKLTSLDVTHFNTTNVTNMGYMFSGCSKLTSLDVTHFNTANVTNMVYMFSDCSKLTSLDVTKLNTAKVMYMRYMFSGCSALISLDVTKFNTGNVTNMSYMFFHCAALTSLDITKFNTANVTNMEYMFSGCSKLTSLDVTNFNTENVTNMSYMFYNCGTLTTIYVSDKFVTDKVTKGSYMFDNCTNLKGFIEYKKNPSQKDHNYANYKTGYFTKLVAKNGDERYCITGETTLFTAENLTLADDKDFVAYEPFAAKAASYSRTINAGTKWATLCLPFEVSLANQNFRAFKLLSADEGTETVELEEIEGSIAAGTPVIIKMKDGATKLNFTVADKEIAKDVQTAETANGNYQLQGLYTKKEFSKDTDNNCYIVKGVKLMNPAKLLDKTATKSVGSKPFRAYMVDSSSASAPAAGARMFSISVGGSTTAIEQLESTADSKAEYYDLQGRRLQNLQKGVNIVKRGGKTMKVIIK